ncbi:hypothetical protein PKHYL_22680 [Psychrobacter sp. KH172YL61]|nr:hypothetical protein PKHYL_22680 [Psychrobacter sp. KH172YL61]
MYLSLSRINLYQGAQRRDQIFARAVDKYVSKNIGQPDIILSNLDRADSILSNSKLPNITYIIHNTVSLLYKFNKNHDAEQLKQRMIDIYAKHPCVCVSEGAQKILLRALVILRQPLPFIIQ